MKKILSLFLLIIAVFTLAGCKEKAVLEIAHKEFNLVAGEQAEVNITKSKGTIVWETSNPSIATISNGVITAVGEGTATITASIKDSSVKVEITVSVNLPDPTSVSISGAKEVVLGTTSEYKATVLPEKASQAVNWSTSDSKIATIDANGKLTPVAAGTVKVIATSKAKENVKYEYEIKIILPNPTGITITGETQIVLGSPDVYIFTAVVAPELANQEIIWSVSDESIAIIGLDGVFVPKKEGTVKVIATSKVLESVKAEKEVTIILPAVSEVKINGNTKMFLGTTQTLTAVVSPQILPQNVTWTTSDANIATISEDGVLTSKAVGTVTVTATSTHDNTKNGQITIEIIELTNDFLIDQELGEGTTVKHNNITFVEGLNAFTTLDKLTDVLKEGSTVYIKPGTYSKGFTVKVNNVTILGPNAGINPNKDTRNQEAIITDIIDISGRQGIVIDGIRLEGKGQLKSLSPVKNVTIKNIHTYDSSVDAGQGIIWFQVNGANDINENVIVKDSLFNDSKSYGYRGVRVNNAYNMEITGNNFIGFFDSIRLEGNSNGLNTGLGVTGKLLIDNNDFSLNVQYPIYVTHYQKADIEITNNRISTKVGATGTFGSIYVNNFTKSTEVKTVVNIKNNIILNRTSLHDIRVNTNDATESHIEVHINYNVFYETPSGTNAHVITHTAQGFTFTVDATENIFLYDGEVKASYFVGANYDPFYREEYEATMIYVNPAWAGTEDKATVSYNGLNLVFGERAFATLTSAIDNAPEGVYIMLAPGTYSENILITKNNVTIVSANLNKLPIEHDPSKEVIYTGKITLGKKLVNLTINGLTFKGTAQILNTVGDAGTANNVATNINGFKFIYNKVQTELNSGKGFMYFVEGASSYSRDFEISYNSFTTLETTALEYVINIDNHAGLRVIGNTFENIKNGAFYVNDTTKGLAGNTLIQGNKFKQVNGDALKVNWLSPLPGTKVTVKIVDNLFEEIGGHSIYFGNMNNDDKYEAILIQYNKFDNFNNGIYLNRVHAGANIHVNYNIFYTIAGGKYIQDGKSASAPTELDATNNFYMNNNAPITPAADKFKDVTKYQTKYTSLDQVPAYPGEGVVIIESIEIKAVTGPQYVGDTYQLEFTYAPDNATVDNLVWESSNTSIATVKDGKVTYLAPGKVTIKVYQENNTTVFDEIELTVVNFQDIDVVANANGIVYINQEVQLTVKKYPNTLAGDVTFTSLSPDIASVSSSGVVKGLKEGEVVIEVKIADKDITSTITLIVTEEKTGEDPVKFLMDANISMALLRNIQTFGNTTKTELTKGSISMLWFDNVKINQVWMDGRPKTKLTSLEFIVVHDTGNNNVGANALMHSNYLKNNTSTSWHFTVDDEGAYQHIPTDEVGYHAGDGLREFELLDTGVPATTPKPTITISSDGYYELNGVKSTIAAPKIDGAIAKTNQITPSGIYTTIKDGKYYMNKTYYNSTYKLISNHGGGSNGIGIESCVDEGSDLYLTWQNLAQLVAKLLVENNLGLDRVMQHNNFSGKNCPQTLRTANLWDHFLKMVEFEYLRRTVYKDYTFKFVSNNPTIVDNSGHIINIPKVTTEVSYTVTITNNSGYNKTVTLYTTIPGSKTL